MLTIYGLKNCSTCKKATKWLDEQGISYTFTDYRDQPIAPEYLPKWANEVGGWAKFVNRASPTWRNLTEEQKSPENDEGWVQLIAEFPTLVRRPVAVDDQAVSVGFKPEFYAQRFL